MTLVTQSRYLILHGIWAIYQNHAQFKLFRQIPVDTDMDKYEKGLLILNQQQYSNVLLHLACY